MKPSRFRRWLAFVLRSWRRPDPHVGWRRRLAHHLDIEERPAQTHAELRDRRPQLRAVRGGRGEG